MPTPPQKPSFNGDTVVVDPRRSAGPAEAAPRAGVTPGRASSKSLGHEARGNPAPTVRPQPLERPAAAAGPGASAAPSVELGPLGDVIRVVAEQRPDLIDVVLRLDRAAKQKAEAAVREETLEQRKEMAALQERVGALLSMVNDTTARLGLLGGEARTQQQRSLEEAKVVVDKYKSLCERVSAERDDLAQQLNTCRTRMAEDAKQQAHALADLQRSIGKERQIFLERGQQAEANAARLEARIAELEQQLQRAAVTRERVLERVQQLEGRLEQQVLPLREQLEAAQTRAAGLSRRLDAANQEVSALQLLKPR